MRIIAPPLSFFANFTQTERQMGAIILHALFPENPQLPNDTTSSSLLANDAARQAQWSNIADGVPDIAFEGQFFGRVPSM